MHATRVLALTLVAACYSTPQPDCGFACGRSGECPPDYQCASDNRCHRIGTADSLVCTVDAPPPQPDAPPADMAFYDAPPDADVTAPLVMSSTPANLATGVSPSTTITVVFDEPVTGVDAVSFAVAIGANAVAGTIVMQSTTTYVFTPNSPLTANSTVTVSLSTAIIDGAGNPLAAVTITFDTGT